MRCAFDTVVKVACGKAESHIRVLGHKPLLSSTNVHPGRQQGTGQAAGSLPLRPGLKSSSWRLLGPASNALVGIWEVNQKIQTFSLLFIFLYILSAFQTNKNV